MELEEARTKLRDLSNVNEEVTPELERLKASNFIAPDTSTDDYFCRHESARTLLRAGPT